MQSNLCYNLDTIGFSGRALSLQSGQSSKGYRRMQSVTRWFDINCSEGLG